MHAGSDTENSNFVGVQNNSAVTVKHLHSPTRQSLVTAMPTAPSRFLHVPPLRDSDADTSNEDWIWNLFTFAK